MLVSYLQAPASDLGYVPLPAPAPINLPDGRRLESFKSLAGIPTARPVYTSSLQGGDIVVVKLGSYEDVIREVMY